MKRRELIRILEASGCQFVRHGSRHDLYRNPANGQQAPIPRHREIGESLVKIIRRQLGIDDLPIDNDRSDDSKSES